MKRATIIAVLVVLVGCAAPKVDVVKNYKVGIEKHAAIGEAMVSVDSMTTLDTGTVIMKDMARAGAAGPYAPPPPADPCAYGDKTRQELIYTGRAGDIIKVTYREYKCDFARPAFFQELTYDLSQSKTVVFKSYKINIVEANNEGVKFTVVADQ